MNIGAPQIIVIVLWSIIFTMNVMKHGENKNERYHGGWSFVGIVIFASILYWGGFFG